MEMDIKIKLPENGNIYEAEFSLSVSGMKVSNREALRTLPEIIKQSLIDCFELNFNRALDDKAKDTL